MPNAPSDHQRALESVLSSAARVPADAWNRAAAEGKWSPAQVVEHLRMTYTTIRSELGGREGFRIRLSWLQVKLVRWRFLAAITREGRFPPGTPAVREVRPGPGPYDREQLLAQLRAEGDAFEQEIRAASASGRLLSHPFLGKLTIDEGLALVTHHLRHHEKQLPGAVEATVP